MAIWDFEQYEDRELDEIANAVRVLSRYGLEPSEDAVRELHDEIEKREEKEETVK